MSGKRRTNKCRVEFFLLGNGVECGRKYAWDGSLMWGIYPGCTSGKESDCQCRRHKRCWFDPWVRQTPRVDNGNPLQYSCLKIPWTEESDRLQSMGLQRGGHNWASARVRVWHTCTHTHAHTTYMLLKWKLLSHIELFVTPWTVACQVPLSMEFSRQEYWSV